MADLEWFDTHAHLSDAKFDTDRTETVNRAYSARLTGLVEIADGPFEWPKAQTLAAANKGRMWWAAGLHPYYADQSSQELWSNLNHLTLDPNFVAIGEIGLDYAKCPIPKDIQINAFREGIKLSLETKKPLVIHCRDAYADLIPVLNSFYPLKDPSICPGVVHCFSGTPADAQAVLNWGFYLGVDAPITYPNAKTLRETFKDVPLNRLVLETDSPYLPPQSLRGKRNEPQYIPTIGQALSELRGISVSEIAQTTTTNARRLFNL